MTDLLIIVPARGGSKRLPGKNLKLLAGKSLLRRTAEAIDESGLMAPVLLTTDNDAIAAEGERLGWWTPFRRPAALASDTATTNQAVLHALDWYRRDQGGDPGAVMVLQPTSPLRGAACLKAAVSVLGERLDVDSVIAMTALRLPPARLFMANAGGTARPLATGDGRRPIYAPNGALYLTRTEAFRRENTLYAGVIAPLALDASRAVDIDTGTDWRLAEALLVAGLNPDKADFEPLPAKAGAVS